MAFDFLKLFVDVFHPEPGERVLVATDAPTGDVKYSTAWQERDGRHLAVPVGGGVE